MARYRVKGPDGAVHVFEGPDDATPDQITAFAAQTFGKPREQRVSEQQAADRALYDPTSGMGATERVLAGAGKAVADTGRGLRQLAEYALPANAERSAALAEDVAESRRLDAPLMDTTAGTAGNICGHILTALTPGVALKGGATGVSALNALRGGASAGQAARVAPAATNALERVGSAALAPTTVRGAATLGALTGAAQPVLDDTERLKNVALGGAAGGAGQAVLGGLSRVIRPNTSPQVQALLDEGITPTPGQILGGGFKRAEEGLTSLPLVGDAIKAGQTRAVEQLNTAAFNRALAPVGDKLPKGMQGREAVEYVGSQLGKRYDRLLPKLTTQADGQFMSEVSNLQNMMRTGAIAPTEAARFESILQNEILGKFMPGANGAPTLTGETMKGIERDLGNLASKFGRSQDADQQMVGDAIREVQDNLRSLVSRSNPQHADEMGKINQGYANFKRVQRAASGVGAEEGVFSAAQLQSAVKALDRSKDKGAFARGDALMQDLAEPAKTVLGPKVPDSGTPFRAAAGAGALGGLGYFSPTALAGTLAASGLYSRPAQNALAALLTRRPDAAEPLANALRRLSPYVVVPAISTTTSQ